jgi:hypothetical protein
VCSNIRPDEYIPDPHSVDPRQQGCSRDWAGPHNTEGIDTACAFTQDRAMPDGMARHCLLPSLRHPRRIAQITRRDSPGNPAICARSLAGK